MTDKKKKNDFIEDDVKQKNFATPIDIVYINPNNQQFKWGETKELANKKEVFKNIARFVWSNSETEAGKRHAVGLFNFSIGMFIGCPSIYLLYAIFSAPTRNDLPLFAANLIIVPILFMALIGIVATYFGLRTVIYRPQTIQELYMDFIQHGKIYNGEVVWTTMNGKIDYQFTSPTGELVKGRYQMSDSNYSKLPIRGNPVLVLYLNDKTHILL